ncbi:Ig domain-containing protein [Paenibacillus sp. NPDC058071]|uniref:Ig-like domain-containing protein n=1 Tax=Paenibacillus sp. NPDC058071 TaxID=3346326 RepID=UPI0036DD6A5C
MNFSLSWNKSPLTKWLAVVIAASLLLANLGGVGIANAADTVNGIEFDYDAENYNSSKSAIEVFIENGDVDLSLLASIAGASSKKDVTANATWKSSNTSYVKVNQGVLTAVGKGTATVSATYGGFTLSIKVITDFVYDELKLLQESGAAPDSKDVELGDKIEFTLEGRKNGATTDVTEDATWTTSSPQIAKVENGVIELLSTGTVTIKAAYLGKSASIKLKVTSPYKSIAISPKGLLELYLGDNDEKPLEAKVTAKDGSESDVTKDAVWKSDNESVATVEEGIVKPVSAGTAKISVTHNGVTASIQVAVRSAYQAIKLSPSTELHLQLHNSNVQIEATVLHNSATPSPITKSTDAEWTSSNPVVATVSEGLITPKAVGTTTIAVKYKGITNSVNLTVYPSISSLKVDKDKLDGFVDSSENLPKVTATTFSGENVDVTKLVQWVSGNESIIEVKDGKWKAVALGQTTLKASVDSHQIEVQVTVNPKPLKLVPEYKDTTIILGQEVSLPSIIVVYDDGVEANVSDKVTWKVGSDNIVLKSTTMRGLEPSSVTLTATYLNKSVAVKVRVEEEIVKIVVEPSTINLFPGSSKSIQVKGTYKSGKTVSLNAKVDWVSANEKVAVLRSASSVKAVDVGTTKLTGSYQGKAVEAIVVVSPKLKSLVVTDKSLNLSPGQTFQVGLTANYTTGSPVAVTKEAIWTTSKSSVATVQNGQIKALAKGSATIKATFEGKSVSVRVTVK